MIKVNSEKIEIHLVIKIFLSDICQQVILMN